MSFVFFVLVILVIGIPLLYFFKPAQPRGRSSDSDTHSLATPDPYDSFRERENWDSSPSSSSSGDTADNACDSDSSDSGSDSSSDSGSCDSGGSDGGGSSD